MSTTMNTEEKKTSYASATVKKLPGSRIEITASVATDVWQAFRKEALKSINQAVTIDGFRKGMVPESILVAKAGEKAIFEEMAELAFARAYVDILIDQKIDAIGKPEVRITKLAADNPLEFIAVTSVVPEVDLPDYRKIAERELKKAPDADEKVTEKEIEDAILRVRKSHVSHEGHDHATMTKDDHDKAVEAAMPELTDDFVKTLGDFKDIPDFKTKLSLMLAEQKRDEAREKRRIRIADALAEASKTELPSIMLEGELNRMESQFKADVERMGVKLEDYLKHAKKNLADIRAEWTPHAEKKAKLQLILNKIAETEKIAPDQKEIEAEVAHIVEHYKDADRERAMIYAETVLTNEKVFRFLEKQTL